MRGAATRLWNSGAMARVAKADLEIGGRGGRRIPQQLEGLAQDAPGRDGAVPRSDGAAGGVAAAQLVLRSGSGDDTAVGEE